MGVQRMNINKINITPEAPNVQEQLRRKIEQKGPDAFAKMLEGVLVQQILQQMNKSMLGGGLFGNNKQTQMFQGMFTQAMADKIADSGGLGLSDIIANQLKQTSGGEPHEFGQMLLQKNTQNNIPINRKQIEADRNKLRLEPKGKIR